MTTTLTSAQLDSYRVDGYVFIEGLFSERECGALLAQAHAHLGVERPERILEQDGGSVRSLYDLHRGTGLFRRLVADRRVLDPARRLLGGDVYIHQTQLNPKAAFDGEDWPWHQDFLYWQRDDGMREPRAVNAVVYLDPMTVFNGPLFVVPGSHREDFDEATRTVAEGWERTLTKELRHKISRPALADTIDRNGIAAPLGARGSVLLFDPRILHGSPSNISPYERTTLFIRYNSVDNALPPGGTRPPWIAERAPRAVEPLAGELLAADTAGGQPC